MHPPPLDNETPSARPLVISSKGLLLCVLVHSGDIIEYRVERAGEHGRVTLEDGIMLGIVAFFVRYTIDVYNGNTPVDSRRGIFLVLGLLYLWSRMTIVHRESAFAFPTIGLQLQTHRGMRLFGRQLTTSVSRIFIPISMISDVIINEGLCGWDVRRYLAVLPAKEPRLQVVFENLEPPFEVLREVYHGLRETLFNEWDEPEPGIGVECTSST
ncbi:hypothetical protein FRC08_010213 [Ceratobasidium sp. 394]|nr:hypothetical protein FRC08_010213 [Ceratobasidium sp. 394]KAG9089136.1 hypothetical protein FS749_001590 [Ceratobasidium sp. UAMH 11750]